MAGNLSVQIVVPETVGFNKHDVLLLALNVSNKHTKCSLRICALLLLPSFHVPAVVKRRAQTSAKLD